MRLPGLLAVAIAGWLVIITGASVARHVAGKAEHVVGRAEHVVDRLHWSTITGVKYPPKRREK